MDGCLLCYLAFTLESESRLACRLQVEFDDDTVGDTTDVDDADMRVEERWVAGERCEVLWEGAYAPATVVSDNGGFSSYTVCMQDYIYYY